MAEAKTLSIGEILTSQDEQYKTIPTPEWGGNSRIGSLSAGDIIEWRESKSKTGGLDLLVKSLVDDDNNRIGKPEHVEAFKMKNTVVTGRIIDEILTLNGLVVRKDSSLDTVKRIFEIMKSHDADKEPVTVEKVYAEFLLAGIDARKNA